MITCNVCPHHCKLNEGQVGMCRVRGVVDGSLSSLNYGVISSIALDPIEKKPLYMFHPGEYILSIGSFGCNLACPFCQNHEIAQVGVSDGAGRSMEPKELSELAYRTHIESGNLGIAYTYNEPLVGYEYVRDTAVMIREMGLYNVLVSNGCVTEEIADEIIPLMDAMNIDLKCFTDEGYRRLGGDFETVKSFIKKAVGVSHIELTTLVVPQISDSAEDMEREAQWIADLDPSIPLHITRFFPRYRMMDERPTPIEKLHELKAVADKYLQHVFLGNV